MRVIEDMNLGRNNYFLSYRRTTTDHHYEIFHAHQGLEFLYVHEGNGHLILDKKITHIESNTLICFQPYQLHKIHIDVNPESPYIRSVFLFLPHQLESVLQPFPSLRAFLDYLWKGTMPNQIFKLGPGGKVADLFREFHDRMQEASDYEREEELVLFIIEYLRNLKTWIKPVHSRTEMVKRKARHTERIMEWIERHYREEFTLDPLAAELHLSPFHISRIFKQDTGSTITEYLSAKRIREASLLLTTTNLSVQQISAEVGFGSDSYFCQLFKKNVGTSPYQYRIKAQEVYLEK